MLGAAGVFASTGEADVGSRAAPVGAVLIVIVSADGTPVCVARFWGSKGLLVGRWATKGTTPSVVCVAGWAGWASFPCGGQLPDGGEDGVPAECGVGCSGTTKLLVVRKPGFRVQLVRRRGNNALVGQELLCAVRGGRQQYSAEHGPRFQPSAKAIDVAFVAAGG